MAQGTKLPKAWASWRSITEKDPKRLAKLAEAGLKLRLARKEKEAEAAALKKEQDELEAHLINTFGVADLREVKTKLGVVTLAEKDVPRATDWDAIWQYIIKHDARDLLQKRLGEKACQERWSNGETIPGVEQFHQKKIKFGED